MNFKDLPLELITTISSYLETDEVFNLCNVIKPINCHDWKLWSGNIKTRYGNDFTPDQIESFIYKLLSIDFFTVTDIYMVSRLDAAKLLGQIFLTPSTTIFDIIYYLDQYYIKPGEFYNIYFHGIGANMQFVDFESAMHYDGRDRYETLGVDIPGILLSEWLITTDDNMLSKFLTWFDAKICEILLMPLTSIVINISKIHDNHITNKMATYELAKSLYLAKYNDMKPQFIIPPLASSFLLSVEQSYYLIDKCFEDEIFSNVNIYKSGMSDRHILGQMLLTPFTKISDIVAHMETNLVAPNQKYNIRFNFPVGTKRYSKKNIKFFKGSPHDQIPICSGEFLQLEGAHRIYSSNWVDYTEHDHSDVLKYWLETQLYEIMFFPLKNVEIVLKIYQEKASS